MTTTRTHQLKSKPKPAPGEVETPPTPNLTKPPDDYVPKSRMQVPGRLKANALAFDGQITSATYDGQTHVVFMEGGGNVEIDVIDGDVVLIDSYGLDFSYYGGELTLKSHTPGSPRTTLEQLTAHMETVLKNDK